MRDIKGYENLYSVTKNGNIFSYKSNKFLKPYQRNKTRKYLCVDLRKNGSKKCMYIHRIVALTYLPNPKKFQEVNHINGDPTDNTLVNLEWCSPSNNCKHAFALNLRDNRGENHTQNKLKEKDVLKIKELLKQGLTHKNIAAKYNLHKSTITKINTGKLWKHL